MEDTQAQGPHGPVRIEQIEVVTQDGRRMKFQGSIGHYKIEQTGPPGDLLMRKQYRVLSAVLRLDDPGPP